MYTNSSLANYKIISPNKNVGRLHSIDTVTIHCVVGQTSADSLGYFFQDPDLGASSNYGVGYDGKIGLYVEEKDRSWCTSSSANDNRAITIEVASDMSEPYAITSAAYRSLVLLLTDICRRNNIKALKWSTSAYDRMNHLNGVNMTAHRDYANKSCPGTYIYDREAQIAAEVNKALGSTGVTVTVKSETGDSGVLKVQKWLNKTFRFGIEEDGICGYYTNNALVKGLQKILNSKKNAGLVVDGIFGPKTKAACPNVKRGAYGAYPSILQAFLICRGYDTGGFDGDFGAKTEAAVKAFQKSKGLEVDGIAGKQTFAALAV